MPEGPEAHTIARKMNERVKGMHILSIEILNPDRPITKVFHTPSDMSLHYLPLPNKIQSVVAHGKRPIFILERGYIVVFLAMTGRFRFQREEHSAIKIEIGEYTVNGPFTLRETIHTLYYNGSGPCGKISYLPDQSCLTHYFREYGPDMLSSPPTIERYKEIVTRVIQDRDIPLYSFMSNQKYVCGVGNYLRADIMYLCKLRPDRPLSSLSSDDINRLYATTISVMQVSYQHGGLTRRDYWDPDGNKGVYPRIIYDKSTDPYGNVIVADKSMDKQTIYWVPTVQL
jgi:formamidopyrimidine-DNA glycosylase